MQNTTLAEIETLATSMQSARALPESGFRDTQLAHLGMIQQRYIEELEETGADQEDARLARLRAI